ncbi:MAG: Ig-like domain-containing protein, partial [Firmicutes bacterium]|nr:Ig-like domain-containing protein [Bacillota bacterium]
MASSVRDGKSPGGVFSRLKAFGHHLSKNPRLGIPALALALALLYAVVGITNNPLRIVKMEPEGEIGVTSNLTFYFSKDVVSKEELGQLMVSDKIRFDPPVPGKIRWEDQKTLKFFPEAPFRPSTSYTVEIAEDIPTLEGVSLSGDRTLRFTTEIFRVKQANLNLVYENRTNKGLVLQGRLVFNHPVALEELKRHLVLRFTNDRTAIGYTVRLENGGREAVITSEVLQYGTTARRIELALPEGFLCLGGSIGLKNRFVRVVDLRERRALKVDALETSTENGVCSIIIRFSEPPDPSVLENFIEIRPELDFTVSVEGERAVLSAKRFETGGTYEVTVKKGLPALNGDPLARDFTEEITFPDLEPSIGFNSPGRYLSSRGHLNLGLETVNVDRVEVEIAKIYANNLVSFLHRIDEDGRCYSYELARLGRVVDSRIITIRGERNKVVTTPLNLGQFLNDQRKGLFQVTVRDPEARWLDAVKIAIITDLGILAKFGADDLVVWVNSLDTLAPYPGVRVSLVSYNNQEIVSGYTDESGVVTFAGIRKRLAESRPYLILA